MVEKNEAYMVFEYLSHDLTGLINHPTFKLTSAHKKDLARQMFEGLDFLHRRGVLHRDIKAANILISSSGQLKYADFGLARFYTKSRQLDYHESRHHNLVPTPPELLLARRDTVPPSMCGRPPASSWRCSRAKPSSQARAASSVS